VKFAEHPVADGDGPVGVVAAQRGLASAVTDPPIQRQHAAAIGDPRRLGELEDVKQFVAEEREPRVGVRIDLQQHADVPIAATRRHQLSGPRRGAGYASTLDVDDEVGCRQAIEDGVEGRRPIAAA